MLSASIPMLPAFLLFWFVDESPRWLISRDKLKKVNQNLPEIFFWSLLTSKNYINSKKIQWIPDKWIYSKSAENVVFKIYFKMYDSSYAFSLVCTKRKLIRCSQLQRVEYDLWKYIQIALYRVISFLIIFKKLFFIFNSR